MKSTIRPPAILRRLENSSRRIDDATRSKTRLDEVTRRLTREVYFSRISGLPRSLRMSSS